MKVISLFAGCGGLDLGFERAGFEVIWANEFDTSIHATYRLNHPHTILDTRDIRTISGDEVPDCDGIIGGPPCQAWSEGGKQLGIEDVRGQLFWDYIRIVKAKSPKFFLIENVKGILEDKHRESLNLFLSALSETGYRVTYELLNAAEYRIPQDRYRVLFVGIRNDLRVEYTFPDAVSTSPVTLRQAIGDIVEMPCFIQGQVTCENHQRSNHDVYTGAYDKKYMSRNRVRSWDEPSFTIQAQGRNEPQHPQAPKMVYVNREERIFKPGCEGLYRRLSVRECARIQSFPDSFHFIYSDILDGYKMVGNAVPPRLAYYLGLSLLKAFSGEQVENDKPLSKVGTIKIDNRIDWTIDRTEADRRKCLYDPSNQHQMVLIGFVKPGNEHLYMEQIETSYYSGRKFPSSIPLHEVSYFMPYIKGKGVKDIYLIRNVHAGLKNEVVADSDDTKLRVIFKLEFVDSLSDVHMPIHLNLLRTYNVLTLRSVLAVNDNTE
jgi:DNA (cytosine-5)-methyltransferase 1